MIQNIVDSGYENIYLSINYLGHIIEEYFGNGEKFSCKIKYLKENKELGTGGPLHFLDGVTDEPIIALNGDLVTEVDFGAILDFHNKRNFDLTVGVSTYTVEVPFGVINFTESGDIDSVSEKPRHNFNINAGLYVINPSLIKSVPVGVHYPMTALVNQVKSDGGKVGAFPIHEVWNDVGVLKQYFDAQDTDTP